MQVQPKTPPAITPVVILPCAVCYESLAMFELKSLFRISNLPLIDGNPRCEFEYNIFIHIGSAISSRF